MFDEMIQFCAKHFIKIFRAIQDRVVGGLPGFRKFLCLKGWTTQPGLTALELLCSTALASRKTWGCLMERGAFGEGGKSRCRKWKVVSLHSSAGFLGRCFFFFRFRNDLRIRFNHQTTPMLETPHTLKTLGQPPKFVHQHQFWPIYPDLGRGHSISGSLGFGFIPFWIEVLVWIFPCKPRYLT